MYKKLFKSDILFTGYYGQLNTGDDAFIEVASWGAEKYWGKKKIRFLARQATLPITSKKTKGYPFTVPKTYHLQNKLLLSSTDFLISAGGSTIQSEMQARNVKHLAIENRRLGSKIKIGGIGVSIGPFKTKKDEIATIDYLKYIDFLAVRDQASFDYVSSLNLPYKIVNAFDLAALLPEIYNLKQGCTFLNKKKIIGISVCPVESISNEGGIIEESKRNAKLVELLKLIDSKEKVHFKFLVINGHSTVGDLDLTKKTIEEVSPCSYEIVNYTKNTQAMWNNVLSCDFIISTRLHAAIFACFSKTPFMLNEYHRKCGDFLENIGHEENLRLYNSKYDPKEKAKIIIDILNDKTKYTYPKNAEKMKEQAKLNFSEVNI